jgi:sulfur-oxidizing protein SoxX
MKRQIAMGILMSLAAGMAFGDTTPGDVIYAEGAVAESLTGTPGDAAGGAKVMADRGMGNCVACHTVSAMPDVAFQGNVGPTLDGAAERWDEAQLRGIVANAKMTFDGTVMPSFYKNSGYIRPGDGYTGKAPADVAAMEPILTATQVEDVVAYLMTLKE